MAVAQAVKRMADMEEQLIAACVHIDFDKEGNVLMNYSAQEEPDSRTEQSSEGQ